MQVGTAVTESCASMQIAHFQAKHPLDLYPVRIACSTVEAGVTCHHEATRRKAGVDRVFHLGNTGDARLKTSCGFKFKVCSYSFVKPT